VALLPRFDVRRLEYEAFVGGCLLRAVDYAGGRDEALCRDRVRVAVGVVLARDPMRRRVEMRPGVLAARNVVPVPSRAALVEVRDLLDAERGRRRELRRQLDDRRRGPQRLRKIDDADAAARDRGGQARQ
jgi:hypothetical protein